MKRTRRDILNGSIAKSIMLFFFPIFFGSLFQQVYSTTDAIVVGNYVGKYALAAVGGSPTQLINLFTGFAVGVSSGASVIVSQFYGKRDLDSLSKAIHTGVVFSVILGFIISVTIFIFANDILIFLGVPAEILADSSSYLRIIFSGFIASLLFNIGNSILRAVGDTKRPLYFLIIACILNIILDIIFVASFKLGVNGVGYATVISQIVSAVLVINSLIKSEFEYKLSLNSLKVDKEILKKILLIGIPAGIQSSMFSLSNLTVQSSVNSLGSDYIAAWSASSKVDSIYWMMLGAFGMSVTTFTAQNYGAKKYDRIKKALWITLTLSCISAILIVSLLYFNGRFIFPLFVSDFKVIEISTSILQFFCKYFIIFIFIEIISGVLMGIGDSVISSIITLVGICVFRILWVIFVFPKYKTIEIIELCYPITWVITSAAFLVYYFIFKPIDRRIKLYN